MPTSTGTRPLGAAGFGKKSIPGGNDNPTHSLRPPISQAAIFARPPPHEYFALMAAEESERQAINAFVRGGP